MSDAAPLTAPVSSIVRGRLVSCARDATIAEAARRMSDSDTASVVFLDEVGRPVGILTDSDLRRRVVAPGLDPSAPVERVMTRPVVTIRREELGLQAIETMLARRIHHLVIVDELGAATGVLADSDLVAAEATGPLFLARRIERATTVDELADARGSYPAMVRVLVDSGVSPRAIGRVVAETNDRLQRRLLDLAPREPGSSVGTFCWLVMGSEGRRTQSLVTDQDNGIIWEKGDPAALAGLGTWMVDALERCGVPRCKGDVMATNPLWRGTLEMWRDRLDRWLVEPDPVPLLRAMIAIDFRGVAGELALAAELRSWVAERSPAARRLQIQVARDLAKRRVPLGPLGGMRLDRSGAIDAKMDAIGVIVDGARLLALELGLRETATIDRLEGAAALGAVSAEDVRDLALAYEAIQAVRLREQIARIEAGEHPDNRIYPRRMPRAQRAALKEHLHAVDRFQHGLSSRFPEAMRA